MADNLDPMSAQFLRAAYDSPRGAAGEPINGIAVMRRTGHDTAEYQRVVMGLQEQGYLWVEATFNATQIRLTGKAIRWAENSAR